MLESFLSIRKQCVKNGIEFSKWVTINRGVPQRTVFRHLVFIMYVKNFPENERTLYNLLMRHVLFAVPNPMKIFYGKITRYLKILTVI